MDTFQTTTREMSQEKIWTLLRKGRLKKETESLLIATQNNTNKTSYVKTKIDRTQQKVNIGCGNRDESINNIIGECRKLAPIKCSTLYNWVCKFELCKKLEFTHTNKWYIHNPESFSENRTLKLLRDFEIWTDPIISARRLDRLIVNKVWEIAK